MADTTWHRALDRTGRLYTIARTGTARYLYLPSLDAPEITFSSGGVISDPDRKPVRLWRWEFKTEEDLEAQKAVCEIVAELPSKAVPGQFFPRMYRGTEGPPPNESSYTATVRVARGLYERLRDIFYVIEPGHEHDQVFGHELRQLLVLACTEVESSWQAILRGNGYPETTTDGKPLRWNTNDYVKLCAAMRLDSYRLRLAAHPAYDDICPFDGWTSEKATGSLWWYDAYNKTKHNREVSLKEATLGAVIAALAGVHVMTVAQFGFAEVSRGNFHADAFNFLGSPRWLDDAYIRPLLAPEIPLQDKDGRLAAWPSWMESKCPLG